MSGKIQLGTSDIIFPVPAALVVTGTFDRPNVLTVAWIGMMSSNPHIIGISLARRRYSSGLIGKNRQFSVNIPPSSKFAEVDFCGIHSGRKTDKFKEAGFTPLAGSRIEPPIIAECPLNMECVVVNEMPFGSYTAFFGEIVETHIDADKISGTAAKGIDIAKVDPLVYMATVREYWSIGRKLGNSFSAGRNISKSKADRDDAR